MSTKKADHFVSLPANLDGHHCRGPRGAVGGRASYCSAPAMAELAHLLNGLRDRHAREITSSVFRRILSGCPLGQLRDDLLQVNTAPRGSRAPTIYRRSCACFRMLLSSFPPGASSVSAERDTRPTPSETRPAGRHKLTSEVMDFVLQERFSSSLFQRQPVAIGFSHEYLSFCNSPG